MRAIQVELQEDQRQMVLLALAKLAVERQGWLWAIEQVALLMDNRINDGEAELFRNFYRLYHQPAEVKG